MHSINNSALALLIMQCFLIVMTIAALVPGVAVAATAEAIATVCDAYRY